VRGHVHAAQQLEVREAALDDGGLGHQQHGHGQHGVEPVLVQQPQQHAEHLEDEEGRLHVLLEQLAKGRDGNVKGVAPVELERCARLGLAQPAAAGVVAQRLRHGVLERPELAAARLVAAEDEFAALEEKVNFVAAHRLAARQRANLGRASVQHGRHEDVRRVAQPRHIERAEAQRETRWHVP
jgi:hypothetical protein